MNGRRGAVIDAMGALDMAMHDLRGKALGKPCHELLGGAVKKSITPYGEAPWSKWTKTKVTRAQQKLALEMSVRLAVAGLQFSREIELRNDESVVYFTETVRNERKADHFFHWTQHVTLGPQFLSHDDSSVALPGNRAITYPHGYDEGRALLTSNEEFRWPNAPLIGGGNVDLSRLFPRQGLGFVVALLLDKTRDLGFVAAVNRKLGLIIAYCFKREDFPWVAIWEENLGIAAAPWKQRTQARGLEFSTTPLPLLRREAFLSGRLFDEPTLTCIAALKTKVVTYAAVLAKVEHDFGDVRDIAFSGGGQIQIQGSGTNQVVNVNASGLQRTLH